MGEADPSEKDVAPKRSKTQRKSAAAATGNKRRRSGTEGDDGSQKRPRGSGRPSSSRRKEPSVAGDEDEDEDGGAQVEEYDEQAQADDALYLSLDNEQPQQIAAKLGLELSMLLELNKPRYKGLTARAKLQPGTQLTLPPRGAGWYESLNDETPRLIATKLNLDVDALVALNKPMYKRLSLGSKLNKDS